METIPNHTMMMTGVRPDRIQVPANAIYDRAAGAVRTLDRPDDLRFPTVLERLRRIGLTTVTVLNKDYLYGIFGTRTTRRVHSSGDDGGRGADGRRAARPGHPAGRVRRALAVVTAPPVREFRPAHP